MPQNSETCDHIILILSGKKWSQKISHEQNLITRNRRNTRNI